MPNDNLFENSLSAIEIYINSDLFIIKDIDPKCSLLEFLRENRFTGTKNGCSQGSCGACTVLIADYDSDTKLVNYRSANSCLIPVLTLNNKQIITIEGLGNIQNPHPIQKIFADGNSSQCGFCTPGIIMSFYSFLKLNPEPSQFDIEESFDGNLCRCTGYRPILDSAEELIGSKAYDSNLDIPFPSKLINKQITKPIILNYKQIKWFEPISLEQALKIKNFYSNSKLIDSNPESIFEIKKFNDDTIFINISNLRQAKTVQIVDSCLEIGANLTISKFRSLLKNLKTNSNHKQLIDSFLSILRWFGSNQIRNFSTLSANILTGSPVSDLTPILLSNDAYLTLISDLNGQREIKIRNFYKGFRKTDLKENEILLNIRLKLPETSLEFIRAYKQSKRKDFDISITNCCLRVKLEKTSLNNFLIDELNLSYGGMGKTVIYLSNLERKFNGFEWTSIKTLECIQDEILNELKLSYSVPGGMASYRRCLAVSFFTRFWFQVIKELNLSLDNNIYLNNLDQIEKGFSSGHQDLGQINTNKDYMIGTFNSHLSALKHTTGSAIYLDDIPKLNGELYAELVVSTIAHGFIKSIDTSDALKLDGVKIFLNYEYIKNNKFGPVFKDEEALVSKEVLFFGQIIGVLVAESKKLAKHAASMIKIEYEKLDEIITIKDAIEKNSFFDYTRSIKSSEFDANDFVSEIFDDIVLEGECEVGGQEHLYIEPQGCLVIPKGEDDELEIIATTQDPTFVQREVATALGIQFNRVVCRVKGIGGAFGGKQTRNVMIAIPVSAAAKELNRPVRCVLDRDLDMSITGNRHSFLAIYKIRVTKDGYFKALDLQLIANAGHSFDLSSSLLDKALVHSDNVYNFQKIRVTGRLAKTNIASNTAFRGFGGPQSMMITEMIISEIAERLKLDPIEIRQKNFYKPNQTTYFCMPLENWKIPDMWQEILSYTNYKQQRIEIDKFNSINKWKKRGISIIPCKFGIDFTLGHLNQANALVHLNTDGSVLINHGGVEMGQGLHTKMTQIAANVLNIPIENIHISETSTDKNANTSPTAASVSSELNGMAILRACEELNKRLKPYKDSNPNGKFCDWCKSAYLDRVSLSEYSFYKIPDLTYDWNTNKGKLFSYFTTGVAVSSVELDLFTGDHIILKSDILMDIGESINYSIDIGQIEGAFIQGVGWCTSEELLFFSSNGDRLTKSPGNYKIPSFRSIPVELNVKLFKHEENKYLKTIKSSKAVGEPPLFLGTSVYFALRDAVCSARHSNGIKNELKNFFAPCTPEVLRLACEDYLVEKSKVEPKLLNDKTFEKKWAIRP